MDESNLAQKIEKSLKIYLRGFKGNSTVEENYQKGVCTHTF